MDFEAILFGLVMLLFFGSDLIMAALSIKGLKDMKGKASWSSMGVVRKGMLVGLLVVMTAFGLWWVMPDSILVP